MHRQSTFRQPLRDGPHDLLRLLPTAAVDDCVIRIPGKRTRWVGALHPDIERIMHEQVHQNRTDYSALRRATLQWHLSAFRRLERRSKPPLDIQQDPFLLD